MSNTLDNLINVSISIASRGASSESYDQLLLIGAAPEAKTASSAEVGTYGGLEEVAAAGWAPGDAIYAAAAVAWSQDAGPGKLVIAVRGSEETVKDVLQKALGSDIAWYGACIAGGTPEDDAAAAEWCEANEKLFFYITSFAAESNPVSDKYLRSAGLILKSVDGRNAYAHVAWAAECFRYEPGQETWAYKTLRGITADSLSAAEREKADKMHLNCYSTVAGKAITTNGITAGGEYIDVIRFRDWLRNRIQTNIYNIFLANPKVPFTDAGITLVESQIVAALKEGQAKGGIVDTEYDGDTEVPGYTVTVPRAADIPEEDRKKRRLSGVRFSAKLAGAVHLVEVRGSLVY